MPVVFTQGAGKVGYALSTFQNQLLHGLPLTNETRETVHFHTGHYHDYNPDRAAYQTLPPTTYQQ